MRRVVALAANAILALAIVVLPWYALGPYEPDGWEATAWARGALALALLQLVAAQVDPRGGGSAALALAALALVGFRVVLPPDFGLDFDGLEVPVERRVGLWVSLAAAATAALVAVLPGRPRAVGQGPAPQDS